MAIVVGCVVLLAAFASLAGGVAIVWADQTQRDDDGFFRSDAERFETLGHAVVSERIDLGIDQGPVGTVEWARIQLQVDSDRDAPVFVGVGPSDEVDQYLSGVAIATVEDVSASPFQVGYRYRPGGAPPGPPDEQRFWVAEASGGGEQTLTWAIEPGKWTVVVMNADGSAGVGVYASVGVDLEWLGSLGVGLLIGGAVALLIATVLVVVGVVALAERRAVGDPRSTIPEHSPLRLVGHLDPALGRWLWLVKWLLVIPHLVVLAVLWLAFAVTTVVAGFVVLFTGRYPRGIFEFNVGVLRWSWRVAFYSFGLNGTDQYPPFTLGPAEGYPASLEVRYPERLSRGLVLVKWWLLAIPHYVILAVLTGGTRTGWTSGGEPVEVPVVGLNTWLLLVAVVALLVTGAYPRGLFRLLVGLHRWIFRVVVYVALMTDVYPPFRLDQGPEEPPEPEPAPSRSGDPNDGSLGSRPGSVT